MRHLTLSSRDANLIRRLADASRRVVVVAVCGRPLCIPPPLLAMIDALVAAWLPGTEGSGVADVLFGAAPASGKLSFSWPRDSSQPRRADRSDTNPLFPFGFGIDIPARKDAPVC